jgi:hypothetical protein
MFGLPPAKPAALRERMLENGYLFVRGFFARDEVLSVRHTVVLRMWDLGLLKPGSGPLFQFRWVPRWS